jgi:RNA polymerase sigma-70 factor (sigma-E family)
VVEAPKPASTFRSARSFNSQMDLSQPSFDAFVRQHAGELLRTASVITWDDDEAQDLTQECLLRIARHWPRVRRMQSPVAYARRTLVNLALDDRRRAARLRAIVSERDAGSDNSDRATEPVDLDAEAAIDALGQRAELLAAFAELSPQQRTVLMLRYFNDLSEAQVAELLGCSTGTVKSSASRGLAKLRGLLTESTDPTEPAESAEVCEP